MLEAQERNGGDLIDRWSRWYTGTLRKCAGSTPTVAPAAVWLHERIAVHTIEVSTVGGC
jgi:hypothetical protein